MTSDQIDLHRRALHILQTKIDAAILALSKLEKYTPNGRSKRLYFAAQKEAFESAIVELEFWQKTFEPTWFQMIKIGPQSLNDTLRDMAKRQSGEAMQPARGALKFRQAFEPGQAIFFAESSLDGYEKTEIAHCPAVLAFDSREKKHHIIDTVSKEAVKVKDARELAHRFRESDPLTFGIMRCKGIVRLANDKNLGFIFRVPDGFNKVHSLRHLLQSYGPLDSISTRLEVARQLVTAVYYVHLYEFVHKNICPETALCLEKSDDEESSPLVCLVGFQVIRNVDGKTNTAKIGDKHKLYCHPSRQGVKSVDYMMQHDIYSLGVCLLEIGLWESLLVCNKDGSVKLSKLLTDDEGDSQQATGPRVIKDQLVALSRGRLRTRMGPKYSKVVEICLTCLDPNNTEFGDPREFQDDDGVEVGDRYVKKVIDIISTISI